MEVGEVQNTLNQKNNLNFFRIIDVAWRFILSIKFKFKIRTFNNLYEFRCQINGYKKILNKFFSSKCFEPPLSLAVIGTPREIEKECGII
jgi:hypothetical protein